MENNTENIFCDDVNEIKGSSDACHFLCCQTIRTNQTPVIIIIKVRSEDGYYFHLSGEHNYLRHFRKIYTTKGWLTIQCTPSKDRLLMGEYDKTAASLLNCLERRGLSENPLVLHLLGSHSITVYNAFTKAIDNERDDLFRIRGTIIDSGPARPAGVWTFLRLHFLTFYNFLMFLLWLVAAIFPEILKTPQEFDEYDRFCYNTLGTPQLYLYSTTDHVVNVDDIENVMSIRHRAGVPIDSKCWHDTEHARHLFTHEEEYIQLCQDFVERVSQQSQSPPRRK